ncbi:hypothetical protein D3C75_531000 [compost metagenome]
MHGWKLPVIAAKLYQQLKHATDGLSLISFGSIEVNPKAPGHLGCYEISPQYKNVVVRAAFKFKAIWLHANGQMMIESAFSLQQRSKLFSGAFGGIYTSQASVQPCGIIVLCILLLVNEDVAVLLHALLQHREECLKPQLFFLSERYSIVHKKQIGPNKRGGPDSLCQRLMKGTATKHPGLGIGMNRIQGELLCITDKNLPG